MILVDEPGSSEAPGEPTSTLPPKTDDAGRTLKPTSTEADQPGSSEAPGEPTTTLPPKTDGSGRTLEPTSTEAQGPASSQKPGEPTISQPPKTNEAGQPFTKSQSKTLFLQLFLKKLDFAISLMLKTL